MTDIEKALLFQAIANTALLIAVHGSVAALLIAAYYATRQL